MGRRSTAKADTPAAGAVSGSGKRLIPRWWSTTVIVVLTVFTLVIGLISAVAGDGLVDLSMFGLAVVSGLVLVSAMSAFVRPRRRREPKVLADGSRVFRAPALTTWPLVAAWIVVLGVAAVWGWVVVTDIGELESPGFSLVMVVGALGSLPDFARLMTGRLHRWTLTVGPDALTYRGYRTDVTVPWRDVRGAHVHERGPAGVRIDMRGAQAKDPIVPIAAFDVPAEQLVEEVAEARKNARR